MYDVSVLSLFVCNFCDHFSVENVHFNVDFVSVEKYYILNYMCVYRQILYFYLMATEFFYIVRFCPNSVVVDGSLLQCCDNKLQQ